MLSLTATATPKAKSGPVEVIRTLRVTRASAVKARTQAFNTLFGVMIGAPSPLRDELVVVSKRTLVNRCLRLRPESENLLALAAHAALLLPAGVKLAVAPAPSQAAVAATAGRLALKRGLSARRTIVLRASAVSGVRTAAATQCGHAE